MGAIRPRSQPQGLPGFPVVGHLPAFLRDKLGFLSHAGSGYGPVVRLRLGRPTFLLTDPEDIRFVLVTRDTDFVKSARIASGRGKRDFGEGLLTSTGEAHRRLRQLLRPVFRRQVVDGVAELMTACTDRMLDDWRPGKEFDIRPCLLTLTQEIITRALFGSDFADIGEEYVQAINTRRRYLEESFASLVPFFAVWPFRINREYRLASRQLDELIYRAIAARRDTSAAANDLLTMLVRAGGPSGPGLTDREIRDEVRTLSIAGYETLAEALTWTLYLVSQHSKVEARLCQEWRAACGQRAPTAADLPRLAYARMVLAEAMRMYPPTWLFVRVASRDTCLPSGARIPRGGKLYLCQYVVHRLPCYYPRPEQFDPERFAEPVVEARPRFAYFPFGGGLRLCLGEALAWTEGVLVFTRILQRCRLVLVDGQSIVPEPGMTLRPRHGIRMTVHCRESSPEEI
jgi:cytochrome P450